MKPYRSLLFVPVLNERALEKSKGLQCDGVMLDLEDSIQADRKDEARDTAIDALRVGGFASPLRMVRVNSVATEFFQSDVSALAKCNLDAIVVPKVETAADVHLAAGLLDAEFCAKDTLIWIMIESALGVMNLREICAASPRLAGMIMGPNDLLKNLRAKETKDQQAVLTSYGLCLLAARANGLICIDGVYKQFTDAKGYAANCAQGRILGFDGKSLIHPAQIDQANAAFGPSADDIAMAKRQIEAFGAATVMGKGVAVVDGELVEALHVDTAHGILKMATEIAKRKER